MQQNTIIHAHIHACMYIYNMYVCLLCVFIHMYIYNKSDFFFFYGDFQLLNLLGNFVSIQGMCSICR